MIRKHSVFVSLFSLLLAGLSRNDFWLVLILFADLAHISTTYFGTRPVTFGNRLRKFYEYSVDVDREHFGVYLFAL